MPAPTPTELARREALREEALLAFEAWTGRDADRLAIEAAFLAAHPTDPAARAALHTARTLARRRLRYRLAG